MPFMPLASSQAPGKLSSSHLLRTSPFPHLEGSNIPAGYMQCLCLREHLAFKNQTSG